MGVDATSEIVLIHQAAVRGPLIGQSANSLHEHIEIGGRGGKGRRRPSSKRRRTPRPTRRGFGRRRRKAAPPPLIGRDRLALREETVELGAGRPGREFVEIRPRNPEGHHERRSPETPLQYLLRFRPQVLRVDVPIRGEHDPLEILDRRKQQSSMPFMISVLHDDLLPRLHLRRGMRLKAKAITGFDSTEAPTHLGLPLGVTVKHHSTERGHRNSEAEQKHPDRHQRGGERLRRLALAPARRRA